MTDLLRNQTVATALRVPESLEQTKTSADLLADTVGFLRNVVGAMGADVALVHRTALSRQLDVRAAELRKREPLTLLNALADEGFAWRDIARIVGVSVPALRKWREGGHLSPPNAARLASFCAFFKILKSDHIILRDAAGWLEQPLVPGCGVTGLDLAVSRRYVDLLALAAGYTEPEQLLDRYHPGWRDDVQDDVEVFIAPDGQPGIRVVG